MGKRKEAQASQQLQDFAASVGQVHQHLNEVLSEATPEKLGQMEPLQQAQVHGGLAQAMVTLFSMYLRTQGVDAEQHPIAKEQKRVSLYLSKVDQAANKLDLQNSKRTLDINVGAANRFISSAIPELTPEQRQKLKEAGQRHSAERPSKTRRSGAKQAVDRGPPSAAAQAAALLDDLGSPKAN